MPISIDELTKVLVLRKKDTPACPSKLEDDFVRGAAGDFGNRDDIVTIGA